MISVAMITWLLFANWMLALVVLRMMNIFSVFYSCSFVSGIRNVIKCCIPSPVPQYVYLYLSEMLIISCAKTSYFRWLNLFDNCNFWYHLDLEGFICNFFFFQICKVVQRYKGSAILFKYFIQRLCTVGQHWMI